MAGRPDLFLTQIGAFAIFLEEVSFGARFPRGFVSGYSLRSLYGRVGKRLLLIIRQAQTRDNSVLMAYLHNQAAMETRTANVDGFGFGSPRLSDSER